MSSSQTETRDSFVFTGVDELLCADAMQNYNRGIASAFKRGWQHASHGNRVLDFGAGMGSITQQFLNQTGVRPTALEIDEVLANIVRSRGFDVVDSLTSIPMGSLDLVFSSNVLEHIENDVATMRHISAALRPSGIFAVYVPAFPLLYSSHDRRVGHVRRYTKHELVKKLTDEHFSILECSYSDSIGFVAALAYKTLGGSNPRPPTLKQLLAYDRLYALSTLLDNFGLKKLFGKNIVLIARKRDKSVPAI